MGLFALVVALTGCGPASIPSEANDPFEAQNRRVHEWNKDFNRRFFGSGAGSEADASTSEPPIDDGNEIEAGDEIALDDPDGELIDPYAALDGSTAVEPAAQPVSPIIVGLANFGTNLDNPRRVLNSLLQLRPGDAAHNTMRFAINSTIGIGGLVDVAGMGGLNEIDTNFSETMHVWGVPEGAYQELPVFGPSTQRDTVGAMVDLAINPLWYALDWPVNLAANTFVWAGEATDRIRYSDTVDSLYFESEDSYSQARLIYLQNRRFELRRGELAEEDYFDPYEELYGN